MHNFTFLLVTTILFSTPVLSQNIDLQENDKIKYWGFSVEFDSLRKAQHIPGLATSIVKDKELVWSTGYGMSHFDLDDGAEFKKVTPTYRYGLPR